jgi:hypothetical protein
MPDDPLKQAIEALGWECMTASERSGNYMLWFYSARCGGFSTRWRASWSEVLKDVKAIKEPKK